MKKYFVLLFAALLLASCKEKPVIKTSFAIPENALTVEEAAIAANNAISAQPSQSADGSRIDYDLSAMNANLVYSQVFDMMMEPEIYDDKVIKMKGNFVKYENSPTADGGTSYAVIISDALACCQQGIEFKYDFGGNEPHEGDEITVTGVYATAFMQGDIAYNFVRASSVEL